jgi:TolB protein
MNRTTTNHWMNRNASGLVTAAGVVLLGGCAAMDPAPREVVVRRWPTVSTNESTTSAPVMASASTHGSSTPEQTDQSWAKKWPTYPESRQAHADRAAQQSTPAAGGQSWAANTARVSFSEEGADFDPCVSRDGSKIVFASTQHRTTADLYIKNVNSKTVTQLTSGGSDNVMPDISPDGERIAFATNRNGSWDIFVMPVTGGQAVQITSDAADELHPSWSPDGKNLVFCKLGEMSGRWEMWVASVQNPASPTFIGYGLFPQWNPMAGTGAEGADKILFQLSRERGNRTFGLWTMDFGNGMASNPTEVASEPSKAFINPTWSPDGQWICYAEIPTEATGTQTQEPRTGATTSRLPTSASLWMIGADGSGKVNLVAGTGASLMPTWSSDGTIFFVSNRGGAENIWSLNSAGAIKAARGNKPNPMQRPVAEVNGEANGH